MKSLIGGSSWIKFCPLITTLSDAIIANHSDTLQLANSRAYMGRADMIFWIILVFRRVRLPTLHNLGLFLDSVWLLFSLFFLLTPIISPSLVVQINQHCTTSSCTTTEAGNIVNSISNFISESFVVILITKLNNFSNCQFNWIDETRYSSNFC